MNDIYCADCGDETSVEDGYWVEAGGLSEYDTFVIVCQPCSPNTEVVEWYAALRSTDEPDG